MMVRAFIGDADHDLRLTPELIDELERVTAVGIAALCRRVFNNEFNLADLREALRLGLIGGGKSPEEAAIIVKTYVTNRPVVEILEPALKLLSATWFGPEKRKRGKTSK